MLLCLLRPVLKEPNVAVLPSLFEGCKEQATCIEQASRRLPMLGSWEALGAAHPMIPRNTEGAGSSIGGAHPTNGWQRVSNGLI